AINQAFAGRALCQQRGPARFRHQGQDWILGVLGRVLEIDPRHQPAQEAAGEQADIDVRRLQRVAAAGHTPGPYGGETEAAVGIARATPEAAEGWVEWLRLIVLGMGVATVGIRLPDLDEGVGHRRAVAVEDAADDLQPLAPGVGSDKLFSARP